MKMLFSSRAAVQILLHYFPVITVKLICIGKMLNLSKFDLTINIQY